MGYKSRGNYQVNWCPKTDCTNRDKKCDECVAVQGKMSEYKGANDGE